MAVAGLRARPRPLDAPPRALAEVLSVALVAATVWAVMSADWVDGAGAALAAGVVATVEAALVARSAAGRVTAALAAPVLGVLVIVPLTARGMPADGATGLLHAAGRDAVALGTGLFGDDNWPFLVGLCGICWLVGFSTGWLALRERLGILAVLPCVSVLAVNALNAPSLATVALPETVALGIALALVAAAEYARLEGHWRRERVLALPGTAGRFGRVTLPACVVILCAATVLPQATSVDLSGRLLHWVTARTGGGGAASGTVVTTRSAGTVQFSRSTAPGGPLTSEPVPVLTYTTSTGEPAYLGAVVDDLFRAGTWDPSTGDEVIVPLNADGSVPLDTASVPASTRALTARIAVTAQGGFTPGYFPGEPSRLQTNAGSQIDGAAFGLAAGEDLLLTVGEVRVVVHGASDGEAATGLVSTATADQLRNDVAPDPGWTSRYTDLPVTTAADATQLNTIRSLARAWVAQSHAVSRYDIASVIENHLRSDYKYTLTPPLLNDGNWPVFDFLTRTRKGYCQYYASAMGTMLRSLGIPTRLVSGYGPGAADDSNPNPNAKILYRVTSSDAHVWVEAYFPGYGWIPFEPTPPSDQGLYQPFTRGSAAVVPPSSTLPSATPKATPAPTPTAAPTPSPQQSFGTTTYQTVPRGLIALVVGLLVLVALVLAAWRWTVRPVGWEGMWRRLHLLGRLLGVRERGAESRASFARRLAAALPPDTTTLLHRDGSAPVGPRPLREYAVDAIGVIALLDAKAAWSRQGLDAHERVRWRRAWRRLCAMAPRLVWRSVLLRSTR